MLHLYGQYGGVGSGGDHNDAGVSNTVDIHNNNNNNTTANNNCARCEIPFQQHMFFKYNPDPFARVPTSIVRFANAGRCVLLGKIQPEMAITTAFGPLWRLWP